MVGSLRVVFGFAALKKAAKPKIFWGGLMLKFIHNS